MKRLLLAFLFPLALGAQTPTVFCDDLCTALVAHGQDSGTAPILAAALELAIANQNAYIARITALEAKVAALTPLPPPACATANGSTVPSSTCLQDSSGNSWTLGGVNPLNTAGGNLIILNGTAIPNGVAGVLLLLYNGSVYTQSKSGSWYQWSGTQFNNISKDPRT
jgi:hypothetical protein